MSSRRSAQKRSQAGDDRFQILTQLGTKLLFGRQCTYKECRYSKGHSAQTSHLSPFFLARHFPVGHPEDLFQQFLDRELYCPESLQYYATASVHRAPHHYIDLGTRFQFPKCTILRTEAADEQKPAVGLQTNDFAQAPRRTVGEHVQGSFLER